MEITRIEIRIYEHDEFQKVMEEFGVKPWYGRRWCRGFYAGGVVHVEKDAPGFLALVAHEIGHHFGRGHTIYPGIMAFSALFRWYIPEPCDLKPFLRFLKEVIKEWLAKILQSLRIY